MDLCRVNIHISDVHFGAQKASDLYFELENVFLNTLIKMPKIDLLTINGDLLDFIIACNSEHSKFLHLFMINVLSICKKRGIPVRIIKGTKSHDNNQLDNFVAYEGEYDIKIIDKVCAENLKGMKILYLPEEYINDPKEYYKEYFKGEYDLIIGHGLIKETSFSNQNSETQIKAAPVFDVKELNKICYGPIIFGHIHEMMNVKNSVFYTGSFSRWCQGEEKDKGFLVSLINLTKKKFTVAPIYNYYAHQYITKNITKALETTELEKVVEAIEDYKKLHGIYKLRIIIDCKNKDKEFYMNTEILKNYFLQNKLNIDVKIKNQNSEVLEMEREFNDKYNYIFSSMDIEEKISKFVSDEWEYSLSADRIKELLE